MSLFYWKKYIKTLFYITYYTAPHYFELFFILLLHTIAKWDTRLHYATLHCHTWRPIASFKEWMGLNDKHIGPLNPKDSGVGCDPRAPSWWGGEACEVQRVSAPSPGLHKSPFKWDVTAPIEPDPLVNRLKRTAQEPRGKPWEGPYLRPSLWTISKAGGGWRRLAGSYTEWRRLITHQSTIPPQSGLVVRAEVRRRLMLHSHIKSETHIERVWVAIRRGLRQDTADFSLACSFLYS